MIHDRNQRFPIATLFSTSVSISEFRRHGLVVGGVVFLLAFPYGQPFCTQNYVFV